MSHSHSAVTRLLRSFALSPRCAEWSARKLHSIRCTDIFLTTAPDSPTQHTPTEAPQASPPTTEPRINSRERRHTTKMPGPNPLYPFTANHTTHQGSSLNPQQQRRPGLPSSPAQSRPPPPHQQQQQQQNPYLHPMSSPPNNSQPPAAPYRNPFSPALRASGSSISTASTGSRGMFSSPQEPLLGPPEVSLYHTLHVLQKNSFFFLQGRYGSPAGSVRSSLRQPPSMPSVSEKVRL